MFVAHITSTPLSQNTDQLLDIKSQNSKTKIKNDAIANSIPSDDDIELAAHYSMIFLMIIMLLYYIIVIYYIIQIITHDNTLMFSSSNKY